MKCLCSVSGSVSPPRCRAPPHLGTCTHGCSSAAPPIMLLNIHRIKALKGGGGGSVTCLCSVSESVPRFGARHHQILEPVLMDVHRLHHPLILLNIHRIKALKGGGGSVKCLCSVYESVSRPRCRAPTHPGTCTPGCSTAAPPTHAPEHTQNERL